MIRFVARQLLLSATVWMLSSSVFAGVLSLDVCIGCHGHDGMGKSDPTYPVIAGTPNSIGAPGRIICVIAIAISASASTTPTVPTLLAGVLAAAIENGEHMTAWLFIA